MAHRFAIAALALGAVLAVAPTSWAGPKDEKSARDDAAPKKFDPKHAEPKKGGDREGGELAERLEALERHVRELTMLVKQRLGGEGKVADHGQPPRKGEPDKAAAAKGEAKPGGGKKQVDKGPHPDKAAMTKGDGKKGDAKPGGGMQLVKGKDGQLLVPLSALPPGMQKEILARSGQEAGEGKGGTDKSQPKPKKGQEEDDGDDDDKAKGKKGEREGK